MLRATLMAQCYAARPGFEGLCRLLGCGWRDQRSIVFQTVAEREKVALEDCLKEERLGYRLQGTTFLLAARAMGQVLLTVDNLATEGVVPCGISWRSFCLRADQRSGFVRRVSCCELDAKGYAGQFPYYERAQP